MKSITLMIGFSACLISGNARGFDIEFENREPNNAKEIVERLKNEPNPSFTLLDSLTKALNANSYLDAQIIIKNGKIIVSSGKKYVISKLIFQSDSSKEIATNRPFDSANVAHVVEQEIQCFRDLGYQYVTAQTQNVILKDSSVILEVAVNKGPLVKYGQPLFTGLTRTDQNLLKQYLPKNNETSLTSNYLKEVERAAEQVPFIRFNPPLLLQPRPGYTVSDIVLNFLEKTPVRFEGAAGMAGQGKKGAVWSVALALNNLFGQGKQVNIASDKRDQGRNSLKIDYSQPVFLLGLGEWNFNIQTRNYRSEFYEFGINTGYSTSINHNFVTGLKLDWKSVKPDSGNAAYEKYSGQISLFRQSYNKNFNPDKGLLLKWDIDFSLRKYTAQNSSSSLSLRAYNETRNRIKTSLFLPLFGRLVEHITLNFDGLETSEQLPPLSELVLIGGPGSLRGYRNEQFAAIRSAYGTFEPRLRFSQSYLFVFYDAAYLTNRITDSNNSVTTDEQFKWGYGLGFGLGNGRRSLGLSLGFNPDIGISDPRLSIELSSDI